MSVKAMGLVWDLECPKNYNEIVFKPSHKFLLVAYADHADHNGRNIWPAVVTISKKTGMDERTVQRLTSDLSDMGLLLSDGRGPKGTNRWALPINDRGDKLSPPSIRRGDKNEESLGDNPSGDNPLGDNLSPELKEQNLENKNNGENDLFFQAVDVVFPERQKRVKFLDDLHGCEINLVGSVFCVTGMDSRRAEYYQDRCAKSFEVAFFGLLRDGATVDFLSEVD